MTWLANFLNIRTRRKAYFFSFLATLIVSSFSMFVTYLLISDVSDKQLSNALRISFGIPFFLAGPSMYFTILHIRKVYILNKTLEIKEKDLSEFVNIIPDIVSRTDPELKLTYVNQKYCEITGHNTDYLIGRRFVEFVDKTSLEGLHKCIEGLCPERPICSHKQFHINPDGSERWIYWTNMMRYDFDNQPTEMLSIGKDITELQFAQKEIEVQATKLESTNRSLELANQELAQFSSIASHDLQEPLRKIGFFSEMLKDAFAENDQETIDYALEVIANSANRGRALVADLLTLSRTSNLPLEMHWIDIGVVVDTVISDLYFLIKRTETKIKNEIGQLLTQGDEQIVGEIFVNLIQNAIKFSEPKKKPIIRIFIAGKSNEKIICAIEDNGIGFSETHAREIFKAFHRLHTRDEYEGTGIGLAIVATAEKRLGWHVYAKSEPGHGATFYIDIPVSSES